MLDWEKLICDHRCPYDGDESQSAERTKFRSPFQTDYDRIIYSKPFRRLARKTQVHPLVPNDHVHNRLTHSLEVASVGRSFGSLLWDLLKRRQDEITRISNEDDLRNIIQAACLAHDIGNPPFGHAGEFAIRTWVNDHPETVFGDGDLEVSDGCRKDWGIFEGNAQGFRLAVYPDNSKAGYMRLTYATLGAMVKYPWHSESELAATKQKYNVFSSERPVFESIFSKMGLGKTGSFVRHPLSFLSEAADDICYQIADLEDAVNMRILNEDRVCSVFASVCETDPGKSPIGLLRANAINRLVKECWNVFEDHYEEIMEGKRTEDLSSELSETTQAALKEVDICYSEIFAHRFKVATELGAYRCLGRIASALCHAAQQLCQTRDFAKLQFPVQKCLQLCFSVEYSKKHSEQSYEWWLHQVLDCVAGMTDNYARKFASELEGYG